MRLMIGAAAIGYWADSGALFIGIVLIGFWLEDRLRNKA